MGGGHEDFDFEEDEDRIRLTLDVSSWRGEVETKNPHQGNKMDSR